MRGKCFPLLCTLIPVLLFILSPPSAADWNPGQPYKWLQAPDLTTTGIDIRVDRTSDNPRFIADDFQCTTTGPITDIHLWGSWLNDVKGNITKIRVSIFEDIPDPDGSGPLFSKPGNKLWSKDFWTGQFTERLYSQLPQGQHEWWWDLMIPNLLTNGDTKVYQYNMQIDPREAFIQSGTINNQKIYWLAIQVELEPTTTTPMPQFGWKTRDPSVDHTGGGHFMDDAIIGSIDATGAIGMLQLKYPATHPLTPQSMDMAFVITTTPSPTFKPDGWIGYQPVGTGSPTYFGDNIYNLDGTDQTISQAVLPGTTAKYLGIVQNDGNVADSFTVYGSAGGDGWTVNYFDTLTNADITTQMTGAGWTVGPLGVGETKGYRVEVTPAANVPGGSTLSVEIYATSVGDPTKQDVVKIDNVT